MKEIKKLLLNFFEAENNAINLERIPNLEDYNQAVRHMYSFTTRLLSEGLGLVLYSELESRRYYDRVKDIPPNRPSNLFKLSHYKHDKLDNVWVGYSSLNDAKSNSLSNAYFVINEDGKLLIAKKYSYTEFYSDGKKLQWEPGQGYNELTFESLGELVAIERYLEPDDVFDSLKLYWEEK